MVYKETPKSSINTLLKLKMENLPILEPRRQFRKQPGREMSYVWREGRQNNVRPVCRDMGSQKGQIRHIQVLRTCSQGYFIQQGCHSEWMETRTFQDQQKLKKICYHQASTAKNIKGDSIKERPPGVI